MNGTGQPAPDPDAPGRPAPDSPPRSDAFPLPGPIERLGDIVDTPLLKEALDTLHEMTGVSIALVDTDGTMALRAGWQSFCRDYHGGRPDCLRMCSEGDDDPASDPGVEASRRCPRGLRMAAVHIVVGGRRLGCVAVGQFLLGEPDLEAIRARAADLGLDEATSLAGLEDVPRLDPERFQQVRTLLGRFADMVASEALHRLRARTTIRTLQEAEARWRLTFEKSPIASGVMSSEGRFLDANPRLCSLLGYSAEEIRGLSYLDITHPDDRPASLRASLAMAAGEADSFRLRKRYLRKDGTALWGSTVVGALRNDDGSIRMYLPLIEDVTEQLRAEEALRQSEARFRAVFEQAHEPMCLYDTRTAILVNPAFLRLLGYDRPEDVLGRDALTFMRPDDAHRAVQSITEVLAQGGGAAQVVTRALRSDGTPIDVDISITPVAYQGREVTLCMARDVTQRTRAEAEHGALLDLSRWFLEGRRGDIPWPAVASLLTRRLRFGAAILHSLDTARGELVPLGHAGEGPLAVAPGPVALAGTFPGAVALDGHPCFESQPEPWSTAVTGLPWSGIRTLLSVPVREAGQVLGTLTLLDVNHRPEARALIPTLEVIADYVAKEIRRRRADNRLHQYQEALRSLASQVTLAEERERRRLAVALHDNVSQTLAAAKLHLGALRASGAAPAADGALGEAVALVDDALRMTRSLTFELSPPVLYELGLEAALGWLAQEFGTRHALEVRLECQGPAALLSDDLRVLLFTAARELLFNVVKHARAKHAGLSLSWGAASVRLAVTDDGRGLPTGRPSSVQRPRDGFGLFSIRERLAPFGGVLEVETAPSRGLRAVISVPLVTPSPGGSR